MDDVYYYYFDYRNLLGEDLGPLTGKELDTLEKQLDVSLKHIRSTRVRLFTFHSKVAWAFFKCGIPQALGYLCKCVCNDYLML